MGSNENPSQPMVHRFGDEELSDATFIVGGEEFKCHKMVLANRSTVFKDLFFSDVDKESLLSTDLSSKSELQNKNKIFVTADPVAFKQLMEILYGETPNFWENMAKCQNLEGCKTCIGSSSEADGNSCPSAAQIWWQYTAILHLADQFDVLNFTVRTLEISFLRFGDVCGCVGDSYARYGVKLIIAVLYGMDEMKETKRFSATAVENALSVLQRDQKKIIISFDQLRTLINFIPPKSP